MRWATIDLLGDPVPETHGGKGRPPHMATDDRRRLVVQLLAEGWTNERIAAALSITKTTLTKHYRRELRRRDDARARVEALLRDTLRTKIEAGDVPAVREYRRLLDRHDLKASPPPPKAEAPGKKVEARRAAEAAVLDKDWASLAALGRA